jgi:uncharacterized protein YyaL (SSP411 family)
VWTPEEIDSVLGPTEAAREIRLAYNITAEGNFEHGSSNPALVDGDFAVRAKLAPARQKLLAYREANRVRPGKDTKVSTAWNCMLIRSLADAGFYFNRPEWLERARKAADFIWDELTETQDGALRLKAVYYEGSGAQVDGFLHDYALAAEAFLSVAAKIDVLEAGASATYQARAQACVESALRFFEDPHAAGFFFTADDTETPVARRKEWFDNATPSGNAALLHALSGLYALTGDGRYDAALRSTLPAFTDYAQKVAAGVAHALEAATTHAVGIAVIKVRAGVSLEALQAALTAAPWRRIFIQTTSDEQSADYQVCIGTQCLPPTNELSEVVEVL